MEKIIVITNNLASTEGAFDFACDLAQMTHSKLTTVAMNSNTMTGSNDFQLKRETEIDPSKIKGILEDKCNSLAIEADLFEYDGDLEEALLFESRFSDLLILARDSPLLEKSNQMPSAFVKKILAKSECPIILAPGKNMPVDQIVFCYDGSTRCLYAIKQFTYLFPEYRNKKVMLLEVRHPDMNPEDRSGWLLHHARTRSWVQSHYGDAEFSFLQGEVAEELYNYFLNKKNTFIVMGAFGRAPLSTLFKRSAAELLIRKIGLPIFIAHQ